MIKKLKNRFMLALLSRFDKADRVRKHEYIKKVYGIDIGKYTYGYSLNNIARGTRIGAFCSIAPGVSIGLMNHPMQYVSTHPFLYYKSRGFIEKDRDLPIENVTIGDDVWIGTNAVILPGAKIGKGAVVGAGAVVTKDIPPYEIWGGVPAKLIKYRFDEDTMYSLSKIDWTEWDDSRIKNTLDLFYEPVKLIEGHERGSI